MMARDVVKHQLELPTVRLKRLLGDGAYELRVRELVVTVRIVVAPQLQRALLKRGEVLVVARAPVLPV